MSGKQLQAGPTEPLSWGLGRDGRGCCGRSRSSRRRPLSPRPGGQYLEAPSSLTHPPCGSHAAFSVRVVQPGPQAVLVAWTCSPWPRSCL